MRDSLPRPLSLTALRRILWALVLGVVFACGALAKTPTSYLDFLEVDIDSREDGVKPGRHTTNCTCGQTNKVRVVGGRETLQHEFPLMAGLYSPEDKLLFCGAAIITVWHALTASHCIIPFQGMKIAIVLGQHDLTKIGESHGGVIPIKRAIEHERYNMETMENDIAFLELSYPMKYTQNVGPACLPTRPRSYEGEFVKVLGWGLTKDGGDQATRLQKANLRVISHSDCAKFYPINTKRPTQICTWMKNRDSCEGDSGGPLLWLDPDTNRFTLAAIVSTGQVCASESPAVYTDVAHFLPWIQAKIEASKKSVRTCAKADWN